MPIELIETIVEKRSETIISQAETSCAEILDDLVGIIKELKRNLPDSMAPMLVRLEDIHIQVCIESSRSSYKLGLLDGMRIHQFCNK